MPDTPAPAMEKGDDHEGRHTLDAVHPSRGATAGDGMLLGIGRRGMLPGSGAI